MTAIIAAYTKNARVIGKNGKIPCNIPDDLKRFKRLTTGNAVIMGRKTFESIGKPLADRLNIVISRTKTFTGENCITVNSLERALEEAKERGFSTVRALCGHGIGREMHEDPSVPNYGEPGHGVRLRRGMTICIEPMIAAGDYLVKTLRDGCTVVTCDGSLCSHYEHTIVITDGAPELLSLPGYHKEEKR